jgi:hypothetical protein
MNDFTIFEFRDRDGNSLIEKIGNSDISELRKFMGGKMTKMDIALIWAINNEENDFREFVDFYDFQTDENLAKEKERFLQRYDNLIKEQKASETAYNNFKKANKKDIEDFKKTNTISEFVANKTSVIAEFDPEIIDLEPTVDIPLLKTPFWTKVWRQYDNISLMKNFFEQTSEKFLFQLKDSDEVGVIDMDTNTIEITVEPKILEQQIEFINSNLNANIGNYKMFKINGTFNIDKFYFDRNVLAMMLAKNNFYDNTLFLNESGDILGKRIKDTTIGKFTITWHKYGPEFSSPVFITFTNKDQDMVVSIAKIQNESEIKDAINMALFLLDQYTKQESKIVKQISKFVSGFKLKTVKKQATDRQQKTKIKLTKLREYAPDLFLENYPPLCTGSKQPRPATKNEIKEFRGTGKLLQYPFGGEKFFTCDDDMFPGIKVNTTDKNPTHKYVPCCYPSSQQAKIAKIQAEDAGITTKKLVVKDYIFEADKILDPGRHGKLPQVLIETLKYHHLDPDIYLRYGTIESSQSIIDVMAMIKDYGKWFNDPEKAKAKIIKELKAESDILNAGLQSYSRKYMEYALDYNQPLSAANFHPILEYYFHAVVIVIKSNDFARPSTSFGFIPTIRKRKNLIILYLHKDSEQVEVIGTYDKNFLITKQKSIIEFLKTKRQIYGFFSGTGYKMPRLAPVSKLATGQYVDSFGKCRGYLINGQSVYTIPSAPSNKPVVQDIQINKPIKLIKQLGLDLLYYEPNILYTNGFVLPTNKKVDLPSPPKEYVMPYILSMSNFIMDSQKSEKDAYDIMTGKKPIPESLQGKIQVSGKVFPLNTIQVPTPNVIILYKKQDEDSYLESLKTRPNFRWEKLWKLEHVVGKTHWVITQEGEPIVIKDVDKGDVDDVAYGVVENSKLGDGNLVLYPQNLFAEIV